jgi:hypothetical protein
MAIVHLQNKRIAVNNTYILGVGNGNAKTVAVSGTFDGGTATPGYINDDGVFIGFKNDAEAVITFTADFQIVQDGGIGMKYALDLTGATTPVILVEEFSHGR